MRWIIVLLALTLASCSESQIEQAQKIQAKVQATCGVVPSIASIAAALAAAVNPATGLVVSGVVPIAEAICDQVKARNSAHTFSVNPCIAEVNGVCIEEEAGTDVPKDGS